MESVSALLIDGVHFGRTLVGLLTRPYETYRRITKHGRVGELVFIAFIAAFYFVLASLIKVAAFRPFILTRQFVVLFAGATSGALVATTSIMVAGRLLRVRAAFTPLLIAWSYTLIPTVSWFFMTSLLYAILPPPRTTSVLGVTFSLLFLVCSATLLWWKVTLAYLTLRFGLKLDLRKSLMVAVLCAPIIAGWTILMYKTGIFKVPFL